MKKKILAVFLCALTVFSLAIPAFANDTNTPATMDETFISTIVSALSAFSATNLGKVLIAALGITIVLVLAWFAYRFITRKVSGAMKKGKM